MHDEQRRCRVRIRSRRSAARTSSMKCRLRVNALPPARNVARRPPRCGERGRQKLCSTCAGSKEPRCWPPPHARTMMCRRDHGRAAERMPDQQAHLPAGVIHELHRPHGVGDLVGERTVAPVALGITESEIVETQHADALAGELFADPARGRAVLPRVNPWANTPTREPLRGRRRGRPAWARPCSRN